MSANATTRWILEMINKASAPLKDIQKDVRAAREGVDQLQESSKKASAIDYYAVSQSVQELNNQLTSIAQPGIDFQDNLADVEAITGVTGEALDQLGEKARASAKIYGGSASDSLNTYKTILSRLGPDIASSQEALDGMEKNVRILSKTMDGDAAGAVDALTTSLLQYRVDLSDPIKAQQTMNEMMNVMAAGAKEGAAEVPDISAAIKVAGVEASKSNVSFVETNAAIQELAKGGKVGAEAGTALRNVLGKMSGEDIIPEKAVAKLKSYGVNMDIVSDTTLPFTARLRELGKAQADSTVLAQVFGVENAAAANILLRSVDAQDELQQKITGTNTAYEQAEVKMATYSERMSRWKAQLNDIGISFFNATQNVLPFITAAGTGAQTFANWKAVTEGFSSVFNLKWIRGLIKGRAATQALAATNGVGAASSVVMAASASAVGTASAAATGPTFGLTAAIKSVSLAIKSIPVIGWILAIIGALIALFQYMWKNFGWFRGHIYGTWNVVKLVFSKIWEFIRPIVMGIWNLIKTYFSFLYKFWKTVFVGAWNIIKKVFTGIWKVITTVIGSVWKYLKKAFGVIAGLFKKVFGGIYNFFAGVFDRIYKKVFGIIDAIVGAIKKAWKWLKGFFGEATEAYKEGMEKGQQEVADRKNKKKKEETGDLNNLIKDDGSGLGLNLANLSGGSKGNGFSGSGKKLEISGGSGKGNKTITQNLEVKNYFNVSSNTNLQDIADQVVGLINDRLRDGLIAAG
ncbi:phage tail tape measure protein [Pseudotenacibaculum haliotis]|uniref:Phage tail tape measure protein n=1 Tax=Pseudotenacibaculum haliotis TaxID=1862138 RepID=A0ABW5LRT2_9FLAO